MVSSNEGYPDPEKSVTDISPNNDIIFGGETVDTDDEEDNNPYNDYEPLPTQDLAELDAEDGTSGSENEEGAVASESLPPIESMEESLVKEVWTAPYPEAVDIVMDSTKVDEVKQAMINFTLPPSAIPEWANNIPEEQWKQKLIDKLQNLQKL